MIKVLLEGLVNIFDGICGGILFFFFKVFIDKLIVDELFLFLFIVIILKLYFVNGLRFLIVNFFFKLILVIFFLF